MKKLLLLIVFAVAITNVFSATYYWVGGAGTSGSPKDWNTGANWSTTSGNVLGTTGTIPGSGDVAIFDGNSAGPNGTNLNPFVTVSGYNIALTGLQILPTSTPANNVVSFIGTASSFSISGDLTINAVKPAATQYNGQISDYGNNTISVAGNINSNASSSCTLVTAPNTNANSAPGRIALTAATPTIASTATGGNLGFLNFDISATTNATFGASANAFTITGNLNIQTGGKLTITKTLQFTSTAPTGINPFVFPGTISGGGTVVGNTTWSLNVGGTLPATYTTSNLQSVGTVNLDPTSATTSSINGMTLARTYSTVTIGTSNNNTVAVGGSITLNSGVLNDGGNTITVAGGTTFATTNTTADAAVHTGTGKIRAIRTAAITSLVSVGKTLTVGNLEIFNSPASTLYPLGTGTNLTINGTLTLTKSGSGIDASGSTITFQNANTPISWTGGTITTSSSTNLYFGSAGNTGGNAFQIPNSVFTSAPTVGSITINRTNSLTLGNQAFTVSNDLNLTSGTLADNGNTISVGGNITGTGSHSGTGKISMTGSSKTISAVTALGNLDINTTGTISATAALPINGNLSFAAAGTLADGGNTITVGGNITGTAGTHLSTGSGKISMTGVGKSFSANTYGNFEIAGGINGSPISSNGSAKLTGGSTFTVTAGSYFDNGFNNLQFGGTPPNTISGTVNISGTAYTQKGNGMWGSFNSSYGWDNTIYTGATNTGITVNFLPGSTAVYTGTAGNTVSALTYHNVYITGNRTSGNISLNSAFIINGNLTIDANLSGTAAFTTPLTNTVTFGGSGTQNITFTNSANNSGASAITLNNLAINSGSNVVSNVDFPVSGSLSGTGSFSNASTKITMTGSTKNISGMTISNLEINSGGTITTTAAPSISGTLSLTSGTLDNTANGITLGNGATIVRTNGTLSAAPTFGTSVNLTYNGANALTPGNEFPTADIIGTLTVNNTNGFSLNANKAVSNLTINTSGIMNVAAGKQLTVSSSMTNDGTLNLLSTSANGTATIITPATITQNSATYNVQQYISSTQTGVNGRNWYISSPLSAATSSTITTATGNTLVYYDGTTPWANAGTTMDVMKGYIAVSPAQNTTINFTGGTLNSGNKSVSNLGLGFNLVGNPYPSYVDFEQATKTNVANSIWYRSKKSGSYAFHTYNVTGGTGVNDGTAIIAPMQSFWIKTTSATNTFGFTNAMRSHQDQSVASNRLKAPKVNTQPLLRLQVSNAVNTDETVIYFNQSAQNSVDDYDSQKMFNNIANVPEIYTVIDNNKLVINGMNTIPMNTEIPLGFVSGQTNSFSIKATELKNFEAGTRIILRDKVDVIDYELNGDNAYTFTSNAVNSTSRFSLLFKSPSIPTDIADTKNSNSYAFVNANNNIVIAAPEKATYSIYNSVGMLIENGITTAKLQTANCKLQIGVYMVNVNNQTTKVIIK